MCKLVKDDLMKEDMKKYSKLVADARYVCKKCGLVSNEEDRLCKPAKLERE